MRLVFLAAFWALFPSLAFGNQADKPTDKSAIDEGISAFRSHKYHKSYNILKPYALGGDPRAQFYLGLIYDMGSIDLMDKNKAVVWYLKAALQGLSEAQYDMGVMCSKGEGTKKDLSAAIRWYKLSAEQNNSNAMYNLGVIYERGYGTQSNISKAVAWYEKAAKLGMAKAAYNLANIYDTKSKYQNTKKAFRYYIRAAKLGHTKAQLMCGYLYESGTVVPKDIKNALSWYTEASINGSFEARRRLANILTKQGKNKEAQWWLKRSRKP